MSRCRRWMCGWREGMMLAGPQLVAGPAAPGGERARLLSLYVQDYLECVESLPLDIQRNVSLLREVDTRCQGGLRDSASAAGQREGREGPEGRAGRRGEGGAAARRTCARRGERVSGLRPLAGPARGAAASPGRRARRPPGRSPAPRGVGSRSRGAFAPGVRPRPPFSA